MGASRAIVRLKQSAEQNIGSIKRAIGLMPARHMVELIDILDLDANPRSSKLGAVTEAIIQSIIQDEESGEGKLLPFKSKGILLAASGYRPLDRGRYELEFCDLSMEGILDGGHNTLAIGSFILNEALRSCGKKPFKKSDIQLWDLFKLRWEENHPQIESYLEQIADNSDGLKEAGISRLDFLVPVELILPSDPDDENCIDSFRSSLLEICEARNNNAQLAQSTKGNQQGLYDSFKNLFAEKDLEFSKKISWKTNDGGSIDVRKLIALAWVPLGITTWVNGSDKILEAPSPVTMYSGKEKCLEKYLDLMRSDCITISTDTPKRELKDPQVTSALKVAVDIPKLFDEIYSIFPDCYNKTGSYGRIGAVKSMMNKTGVYKSPFYGRNVGRPVPEGFIYPLIYGLRSIICLDSKGRRVSWKVDPFGFVRSGEFASAVEQYCGVISQSDYDPQKVGKGLFSYTSAENAIKLAYLEFATHGD